MAGSSPQPSYKRLYKTARWQRLRWATLVRDRFTCKSCKRMETDTSRLVADHIERHMGDEAKFWDAANLQTLCKPCHDGDKQSREKGGRGRRIIGPDGWPAEGRNAAR